MPQTSLIDAEIAGTTANSYVTLDEADEYFARGLHAADWQSHGREQRERALISATQIVERLRLAGARWDATQSLHFPTTDDTGEDGSPYIPVRVGSAICEQALWLLQQQSAPELLDRATLQAQGVVSVSLDGISETYSGDGATDGLCASARQLLDDYTTGRGGRVRTVTVQPRFAGAGE